MGNAIVQLDLIRNLASGDYQKYIPEGARVGLDGVKRAMEQWTPSQNEFLDVLINKIALTQVKATIAKNKLAIFKSGKLGFGDTIEEIWVNMAETRKFDVEVAEQEVFKRVLPEIDVKYHSGINEMMWKVTVQRSQLNRAFTSEFAFTSLVSKIVQSLYNKRVFDEYLKMKQVFTEAYENERVKVVYGVEYPSDSTKAKEFVKSIKRVSKGMTYLSTEFNADGKLNMTPTNKQVLLLNKDIGIDVPAELLASAFNKGEFDYDVQVVEVDSFGSNTNIIATLVDRDWFQWFDTFEESGSIYNPEGLYWNYTLHHHQLLSYSTFMNAVFFTTEEAPVTEG